MEKKTATLVRTFTQDDVEAFAKVTGDSNPVHLDAEYAAGTRFGQRIAHGMLAGSLFSTIFGTVEPGPGALYLGQDLKFKAPVLPGDDITATVTLEHLREDKPIATYSTIATNQRGETVISGQAVLFLPR